MVQTTLKNIIDIIQAFATGTTGSTQIQTVNFGDMDKVSSSSIVFPFWRLNHLNSDIQPKRILHNFQIAIADENVGQDEVNLPIVYNKLNSIAHQFYFYLTYSTAFRNIIKIESQFKYYSASSKFLDGTPAIVIDLTLSVHNYLCYSDVNITGGIH